MELLEDLRALVTRHAGIGRTATAIENLAFSAYDAPTDPVQVVYQPLLAVIVQGAKRTVLGDKVFNYAAGQYLVVSLDLPVTGHVITASSDEPYLVVALTLKPATIAALLMESAPGDRGAEQAGIAVSEATADLLDPIVRLVRLLDRPADIPVLAPMIEREILWRLLAGEQGALVRQIGLADSRLSQINHAIRWIREHYAQPLRIEELARIAAMSASSFHRHFRTITAMSPLQYQKQIRLQEARAQLLASSGDVAGVGFSVGYDSPSQFSREYSRLFGAPPGKDATRLRAAPILEHSVA